MFGLVHTGGVSILELVHTNGVSTLLLVVCLCLDLFT